jgi:2-methylcitrate dehydratase PrpD
MGITIDLATYCAGLKLADLPTDVVVRTRQLVLDLVGNIVRGRHDSESTPALLAAAKALGLTGGTCHVFADAAGYTPAGAAFLNGAFAHSLDFDDTHAAASLHPGAPVIPAALAAAEMTGANGETVLAAIVAGYEVVLRIALALPAGAHYDRGFHPTATCGAFGAAAAAARVFGLDAGGMENALGIALSQSSGSLQFLANGAWTKRFQVGWAAMAGLTAATLAREGFRGASEALEGQLGFLQAYAPAPNPARVTQDLGTVFELMNTAVKPYPSCRYGHAGIDGVLALRAEYNLKPEEVESITYGLSNAGLLLVGVPAEKRANPQNVVDAQFSGPFVLSCALATGAMGWDSYGELQNPAVRALLAKVSCVHDDAMQAEFPTNMSGTVTIHARGQDFTRTTIVPKGEPGNFLTDTELRAKFLGLTGTVMGDAAAERLADNLLRFETATNMKELIAA